MGNIIAYVRDYLLPSFEAQPQMPQMPRGRGRWTRAEDDLQEAFVAGAGAGARVGSLQFWNGCRIPGRTDKAKRDRWARRPEAGGRRQRRRRS